MNHKTWSVPDLLEESLGEQWAHVWLIHFCLMLQVVPKPKNVFKSIHVPELYVPNLFEICSGRLWSWSNTHCFTTRNRIRRYSLWALLVFSCKFTCNNWLMGRFGKGMDRLSHIRRWVVRLQMDVSMILVLRFVIVLLANFLRKTIVYFGHLPRVDNKRDMGMSVP